MLAHFIWGHGDLIVCISNIHSSTNYQEEKPPYTAPTPIPHGMFKTRWRLKNNTGLKLVCFSMHELGARVSCKASLPDPLTFLHVASMGTILLNIPTNSLFIGRRKHRVHLKSCHVDKNPMGSLNRTNYSPFRKFEILK